MSPSHLWQIGRGTTKAKKQNLGLRSPPKNGRPPVHRPQERDSYAVFRALPTDVATVCSLLRLRILLRGEFIFTLSAIESMSRHPLLSSLSLRCHRQLSLPQFWTLEKFPSLCGLSSGIRLGVCGGGTKPGDAYSQADSGWSGSFLVGGFGGDDSGLFLVLAVSSRH